MSAPPMAITQAIAKYYAPGMRNEVAAPSVEKEADKGKKGADKKKVEEKKPVEKAAPKPRRRGPKSEEEIRQDRMIGIVIINFSFFASYLLDWQVITPNVFFDTYTFLLFITIPGIAALVAWQMYWKK
jgi:hypothetical protein